MFLRGCGGWFAWLAILPTGRVDRFFRARVLEFFSGGLGGVFINTAYGVVGGKISGTPTFKTGRVVRFLRAEVSREGGWFSIKRAYGLGRAAGVSFNALAGFW